MQLKAAHSYLNRPKAEFGKRAASSITKRELMDQRNCLPKATCHLLMTAPR